MSRSGWSTLRLAMERVDPRHVGLDQRIGDDRGAPFGRAHRFAKQQQRTTAIDPCGIAHDPELPQHFALGLEIVLVRRRLGALQREQFVDKGAIAPVEAVADLLQRGAIRFGPEIERVALQRAAGRS
jgi:hypothetical protein